ncbi:hypothetical protein [Parasitella parasitica]|uniref:Uncharacterized protein n=1 Tax=Parasitella parasitica TaxID=35722 RepID=A0A0B7NKE2_9FUNG|nr:hypothetical protein [Parasitella parasitica]
MTTTTVNITSTTVATNDTDNNPFVNTPAQGDDTTISAEDILNLLESLKVDNTSEPQLQAILERAKNGECMERDLVMSAVASLLPIDTDDLNEFSNFDIQLQ